MRGTRKTIRSLVVILFLLLWLGPKPSAAVDFLIGFSFGRSFSVREQSYSRSTGIYNGSSFDHFATPELRAGYDFSLALFYKYFGFTVDFTRQAFDEVWHETINGLEASRDPGTPYTFYGLAWGVEFRLFADKDRRFNPSVSASQFNFFYAPYVSLFGNRPYRPEFPQRKDIRLTGGLKIKVVPRLFVDLKVAYFPKNSLISGLAGFGIIF